MYERSSTVRVWQTTGSVAALGTAHLTRLVSCTGHNLQRRVPGRLPDLLEHLGEDLGGLRTRDGVLTLEHEERHAGRTVRRRPGDVGSHRIGVRVAGEHLVDAPAVEPGPGRDLAEHGVVGQVARLLEVR